MIGRQARALGSASGLDAPGGRNKKLGLPRGQCGGSARLSAHQIRPTPRRCSKSMSDRDGRNLWG